MEKLASESTSSSFTKNEIESAKLRASDAAEDDLMQSQGIVHGGEHVVICLATRSTEEALLGVGVSMDDWPCNDAVRQSPLDEPLPPLPLPPASLPPLPLPLPGGYAELLLLSWSYDTEWDNIWSSPAQLDVLLCGDSGGWLRRPHDSAPEMNPLEL